MTEVFSFHYSPVTGNTSRCRAVDKSKCPYGGHASGATAEEAFDKSRFAYEQVMADYSLVSFTKTGGKRYDHKAA